VWNLFSHSGCGTYGEGVWEQGADKNDWTYGSWSNRKMEKIILNEEFLILLHMCRYASVCSQVSVLSGVRFPGYFLIMFGIETLAKRFLQSQRNMAVFLIFWTGLNGFSIMSNGCLWCQQFWFFGFYCQKLTYLCKYKPHAYISSIWIVRRK
jgi:hypothetical protein